MAKQSHLRLGLCSVVACVAVVAIGFAQGVDPKVPDAKKSSTPPTSPNAELPQSAEQPAAGDASRKFDKVGPQAGDKIPDIPMRTLDDEECSTADARGYQHTLFVTSSLTCPKSRSRWPELKQLAEKYDDLHVVLIYVIEAHPIEDVCPYKGVEDVTEENRRDGILRRQPKAMQDRLKLASEFRKRMAIDKDLVTIQVDTMDDLAWKAFGGAPNLALLTDSGLTVQIRQGWFNAKELIPLIDEALKKNLPEDRDADQQGELNNRVEDQLEALGKNIYDADDIIFGKDASQASTLLTKVPELVRFVRPLDRPGDRQGDRTLLVQAAEAGNLNAVKLLVKHGSDVNAQGESKPSALHFAAKAGNLELAELLIKHRANVNLPSSRGKVTPLHEAIIHHQQEVAEALVKAGARHDFLTHVGSGNIKAVRAALKADPARAYLADGWSRTPLAYAAATGQIEAGRLLLSAGAIPENSKRTGEQPLHWAAKNNQPQMADLLLGAGASSDIQNHGAYDHDTALHIAVARQHEGVVRVLLRHRANTELMDWVSLTPLHRAATLDSPAMIEILLKVGAKPEAQQQKYETPCGEDDYAPATLNTPLHLAARAFQPKNVTALLAAGAKVNAENAKGATPLALAVSDKHGAWRDPAEAKTVASRRQETIRLLLAAGATRDATDEDGHSIREILREKKEEHLLK